MMAEAPALTGGGAAVPGNASGGGLREKADVLRELEAAAAAANAEKARLREEMEAAARAKNREKREALAALRAQATLMRELFGALGPGVAATPADCYALAHPGKAYASMVAKKPGAGAKYEAEAKLYNEANSAKAAAGGGGGAPKAVSFLGMLKEAKAEADAKKEEELGMMGKVMPVGLKTDWHVEIEEDPLAALLHFGFIDRDPDPAMASAAHVEEVEPHVMSEREDDEVEKEESTVGLPGAGDMTAERGSTESGDKARASSKEAAHDIEQKAATPAAAPNKIAAKRTRRGKEQMLEHRNGVRQFMIKMAIEAKQKQNEAQAGLGQESKANAEESKADEPESKDAASTAKTTITKEQAMLDLFPMGTSALLAAKATDWSKDGRDSLRSAVLEIGIQHITEEQYHGLETSDYYNFSLVRPMEKNLRESCDTHGPTFRGLAHKLGQSSMMGSFWHQRHFVLDSTYLRYWHSKAQSQCIVGHHELAAPRGVYDLRCVERVFRSPDDSEKEFTVVFNGGDGSSQGGENAPTTTTLRMRAMSKKVANTWMNHITHRVSAIVLIGAIVKARSIVRKREEEAARRKKEAEERAILEAERAARFEARRIAALAHTAQRDPGARVLRIQLLGGNEFLGLSGEEEEGETEAGEEKKKENSATGGEKAILVAEMSMSPYSTMLSRQRVTQVLEGGSAFKMADRSCVVDIPMPSVTTREKNNKPDAEDDMELQISLARESPPSSSTAPGGGESKGETTKQQQERLHTDLAYTFVDLKQLVNSIGVPILRLPITHITLDGCRRNHGAYIELKCSFAPVLFDHVELLESGQVGALIEVDPPEQDENAIAAATTGGGAAGTIGVSLGSTLQCKVAVYDDQSDTEHQDREHAHTIVTAPILQLKRLAGPSDEEMEKAVSIRRASSLDNIGEYQVAFDQEEDDEKLAATMRPRAGDVVHISEHYAQVEHDEVDGCSHTQVSWLHYEGTVVSVTTKEPKDYDTDAETKDGGGEIKQATSPRRMTHILHSIASEGRLGPRKPIKPVFALRHLHYIANDDSMDDISELPDLPHIIKATNPDVHTIKLHARYLVPRELTGDRLFEAPRREKTDWEVAVDQNKRALIVHFGWKDDESGSATASGEARPDGNKVCLTKRVLPLHDMDDHELGEELGTVNDGGGSAAASARALHPSVSSATITDGAALRHELDEMELFALEESHFEDMEETDFWDVSQRLPICKRQAQNRPSHTSLLGPAFSGELLKKSTHFLAGVVAPRWKRRFFALDCQYLRYWKNSTDGKRCMDAWQASGLKPRFEGANLVPGASIDLRSIEKGGVTMVGEMEIEIRLVHRDNAHNGAIPRAPYRLRAESKGMAHRWLKEIQYRIRNMKVASLVTSLYKTLKSSEGSDSFVLGRHGSAPQLKRIPTGKNLFARSRPLLEPIDVAAALVDETSESQSAQRPQTVPARVRPRARRTSFVLREAPMKKMRSKKIVFQKDE